MPLLLKLKPFWAPYSSFILFFLIVSVFYPLGAEDAKTTLGDLSARIEELENQINGKEGKTDDVNPGSRVSQEDLDRLKDDIRSLRETQTRSEDLNLLQEEIRTLRQDMKRLQKENMEWRSRGVSKKPSPFVAESSLEKEEETGEKDEETESILKLLEQSAPGEDEGNSGGKKKQKKDLETGRETAAKEADAPPSELHSGNAEAQYNEAFALHNKGAFKEAQRAFAYFIKTYPNSPLVLKATYWHADSCFRLGNYKEAKILFVNAYKKNPQSAKAPHCLLKLGEILAIQGKKGDACIAWGKLERDFPHMTAEMKNDLAALKQQCGCDQKTGAVSKSIPKD